MPSTRQPRISGEAPDRIDLPMRFNFVACVTACDEAAPLIVIRNRRGIAVGLCSHIACADEAPTAALQLQ
jgi:hypothetical protein